MRSTADPAEGWILRLLPMVVVSLVIGSPLCAAQPDTARPCGHNYAQRRTLDLAKILAAHGAVSNLWGRENMRLATEPQMNAGASLRVDYPRGSVNPGAEGPVGGGGFKFALEQGVKEACLTYSVRFPADFEFAKGGKLPGLYGGDAPRGCVTTDASKGFSARLMWRGGGAGELYLYHPGQTASCGESIARGAWTFSKGAWVSIAEQVMINTPGQADGTVRVWIDGQPRIEANNLILRDGPDSAVDGLLFSTFFGGSDPSWASPKDQSAEFKDFSLLF